MPRDSNPVNAIRRRRKIAFCWLLPLRNIRCLNCDNNGSKGVRSHAIRVISKHLKDCGVTLGLEL